MGSQGLTICPTRCSRDLIDNIWEIMAHSVVHTGLGFSCLTYAIYYYICTGKTEGAVPYLTIAEAPCYQTKELNLRTKSFSPLLK